MNFLRKEQQDPQVPAIQTPPKAEPVRRRISDAAALAAQHVIDLENALDAAHRDLQSAQSEALAFRRMCEEYRMQIDNLTHERDWHKQRHTDMDTTLHNAASMIVNCYDRGHASQSEKAVNLKSIESQLTEPAEKPVDLDNAKKE
jgi:hypothetical protein